MRPAQKTNRSALRSPAASLILVAGFVGLTAAPAALGGTLEGYARIQKVLNKPLGYMYLNEWNNFVISPGVDGQAFRCGTLPYPAGYFEWTLPAGTYSMYLDQPLFWGRPKVVWGVDVPASGTISYNVELPMDYSCVFGTNSAEWGLSPWTTGANVWYQTFIATGTSVTGINFKLAGTPPSEVYINILQDNGGNITTWPEVGPGGTRTCYDVNQDADSWIRCRSGDYPTTPGQRYALKLTGSGGSYFSIYRRMEDGNGYALGQAYNAAGQAQNFDLYANIFSDNDGTLLSYCTMLWDDGYLPGWAGVWSQEVKAMGNGLAGATLYFARDDTWDIQVTFQIRSGGPTGPVISPVKTAQSAAQGPKTGHVAVSYNPGEVMLTPGQLYYIEASNDRGFNPYAMNRPDDVYLHGMAYKSYIAQPSVDLHMQVLEYASVQPATLVVSPTSFTRTAIRKQAPPDETFTVSSSGGSFMTYTVGSDVSWLVVNPTQGSSLGEADPITISYNIGSLLVGDYTGTITVNAPGAANPQATVTVHLTTVPPPYASADFDHDGDVDLDDFGHLQACFSGAGHEQNDPACQDAKLNDDSAVDQLDLAKMKQCSMGAGTPVVDTTCSD